MDTVTLANVRSLIEPDGSHVVSVYQPTHRAGREMQQDPISLKNLLSKAETLLIERGLRPVAARELLQPAVDLVTDDGFWKEQSDGLALFVSQRGVRYFRVEASFASFVHVGRRAYVRPLLPLTMKHGRYYVLAVSQKGAHLWRGNFHHVTAMPDLEVPGGLAALHFDRPEGTVQVRTTDPALRGKEGAVFHGQGGRADDHKHEILSYFRMIDRRIRVLLRGENAPLVFAGVGSLFPIYQHANSYARLWPEPLSGNPDRWTAETLCRGARGLLEDEWKHTQRRDAERFARLAHPPMASCDVAEVVAAAQEGRVDVLFAGLGCHAWGQIDTDTGRVEFQPAETPGTDDLIELGVLATLEHGGRVFAVPDDQVPGGGDVAAIFRYAAGNIGSVKTVP